MRVPLIVISLLFAAISGTAAPAAGQGGNDRRLEGTVRDSQGLPVVGARVTLEPRAGGAPRTATTAADGFELAGLAPGVYDLRVEAEGFEGQTITADLRNASPAGLEIRLQPARLAADVLVSAGRTEQRLGDVPASARILAAGELRESPAVAADEILRQVPTFSLFRRTSSLAAHPTAQGVSLRGIGTSGVSRTLVLVDDVPFNDPFGGWVYWTRVPTAGVNRVEIVDTSTSSVYGNYAMGGVIHFVTDRPTPRTLILEPQYGGRTNTDQAGRETWDGLGALNFFASDVWGDFGAAVEGSVFGTNGYPIVADSERGPVDTKATVDYHNFNVKLDYSPSDRFTAFARGGYFSEERSNAKICLQAPIDCAETNDSLWKSLSGGFRAALPDQSDLQARVFGDFKTFHSSFLAVPDAATTRSIARLSLLQAVPTNAAGFMTQWSKALGARHYLTAGFDWRWVDGDSNETVMNQTTGGPILSRVSGGTQRSVGFFLQDAISVTPRLQLTLSARLDRWRNYDGHNLETLASTGGPAGGHDPDLPDKTNTVGSPRVAALYRVRDNVTVWGSLGGGFRAPTLNELYRQFRVGTVVTTANFNLGPERLVAGEAGVNIAPAENLTWRTTWFHNRLTNPVSNVTIAATPSLITRQRQNLGRARIWGLQSDVEYRFNPFWRASAGYLYNVARVKEFATEPDLVGRFLPQVPMHRGSLQLAFSDPRYLALGLQAQFVGGQYDDDRNTSWLPYYGVLDVNARRSLADNVEVFFGVQNLFDREIVVQRNPTTVGAPRLVTGGLRVVLGGR